MDLGASPIYAFFKVVFPDILPGVLSGFLLAFTMSLDDFIITHFTKGAGISTLSTLIYSAPWNQAFHVRPVHDYFPGSSGASPDHQFRSRSQKRRGLEEIS